MRSREGRAIGVPDLSKRKIVVAVDGPGKSGKSTVCRKTADVLDMAYLDTGSIYRAVTWACLLADESLDNGDFCAFVAETAVMEFRQGAVAVVNGEDATSAIRSPEVTANVSLVSSHPSVRAALLRYQRGYAKTHGGIIEGRDIGSVVLRDLADVKVFLTASPMARAARQPGAGDIQAVAEALRRRDEFDSSRATAPLVQAPDAILLDSTHLDEKATISRLVEIITEHANLAVMTG